MSGVLFVICVPRERYEKSIDNSLRITQDDLTSQNGQATSSSDSSNNTNEHISISISDFSGDNNPKDDQVAIQILYNCSS
jgi:hypothetical protein